MHHHAWLVFLLMQHIHPHKFNYHILIHSYSSCPSHFPLHFILTSFFQVYLPPQQLHFIYPWLVENQFKITTLKLVYLVEAM